MCEEREKEEQRTEEDKNEGRKKKEGERGKKPAALWGRTLSACGKPIGPRLADRGARDPARADSARGDVAWPVVGRRVAD